MFSTLEANSGYCKFEIFQKDRETAFTSHDELNPFICMLFGLIDFPGTFKHPMHESL